MQNSGGGEVASQETTSVGEHCPGVDQGQHDEGDGPDSVEYLKQNNIQRNNFEHVHQN